MRIIAGEYKGRQIKTTIGPGYRPAMSKVREAIFSMLESRGMDWDDCRVLDVFAGSGSLGFEALSRGALEVLYIESLPRAARLIQENADFLGVDPRRLHIALDEAGKVLNRKPLKPYDIVFIDPPYGKRLLQPTLSAIIRRGWIAPGGVINAEIEGVIDFDPTEAHKDLEVLVDRKYGQTRVILWTITSGTEA